MTTAAAAPRRELVAVLRELAAELRHRRRARERDEGEDRRWMALARLGYPPPPRRRW